VFLAEFQELPDCGAANADWNTLIDVREDVAKALEALRDAGTIGSALEANVTLYADGELADALNLLDDELRFVFITSTANVRPLADAPADATNVGQYQVLVTASDQPKCIRCWHRRKDVGSVAEHPEICGRCASNVSGASEQRAFA
jgi:isoleucyl-tRNA synthetase